MLSNPQIISDQPAAGGTLTILSTPLNTGNSIITEFIACNLSNVNDQIRISVNGVFIYHDLAVPGNTSFSTFINGTNLLPPGTKIEVYSLNGTIVFTIFCRS